MRSVCGDDKTVQRGRAALGEERTLGRMKRYCVVCGKEFDARTIQDVCCSPECARQRQNARKEQWSIDKAARVRRKCDRADCLMYNTKRANACDGLADLDFGGKPCPFYKPKYPQTGPKEGSTDGR